jgi:prefoldin subunit 1
MLTGNKRFVLGSTNEMQTKLASQSTELKSDVTDLNKKLHYLETTAQNSRDHIEQLLRSGGHA